MAVAETAQLAVKLTLDDSKFTRALRNSETRLQGLGRTAKTVGKGVATGIGVVAVGGVVLLVDQLKRGIDELKELETVTAQTEAVIASTGAAAGVSAEQVRALAEKYEDVSAVIDDKVIQSAENMLLTFTNVTEDAFEPALAAALDMSTALGIDVVTAAKDLGKALQDPEKGLGKLERKIGPLDEKTRDLIASLMEQGDVLGAQKVLLDEVSKRYGGSFAATADTAAGKQAKLADKVEEVQKALAEKLLPVVGKVADRLAEYLGKPSTLAFFEKLSTTIASLFTDENLDAAASAMETAATAVGTAISAFNKLPPEIKALAIGAFAINKVTGGAVGGAAEAFGKILGAGLKQIFAANVTVIGTNVTSPGGVGGGAGGGDLPGGSGKGGNGKTGGNSRSGRFQVPKGAQSTLRKLGLAAVVLVTTGDTPKGSRGGAATDSALLADLRKMLAEGRGNENIGGGETVVQAIRRLEAAGVMATNESKNAITANERGEGAKHRAAIARLETKQAQATAAVRESKNAITANDRGEQAKNRAKLDGVKTKQQESLVAFRAGERATLTGNSLQRTANARLEAIKNKKTSFRVNNTINVSTRVSVADLQQQILVRSRTSEPTYAGSR